MESSRKDCSLRKVRALLALALAVVVVICQQFAMRCAYADTGDVKSHSELSALSVGAMEAGETITYPTSGVMLDYVVLDETNKTVSVKGLNKNTKPNGNTLKKEIETVTIPKSITDSNGVEWRVTKIEPQAFWARFIRNFVVEADLDEMGAQAIALYR